MTTEVCTLSEAAKELRITRETCAYLIRDRQIPIRRVGKCKLLDRDGFGRLRDAVSGIRAKPEPVAV